MWSKCADENVDMTFVVCVLDAKYFAPPLFIIPRKRLNRDVLEGCNIEGSNQSCDENWLNKLLPGTRVFLQVTIVPGTLYNGIPAV